jgi:hypothetical protein
MHAAAGAPQGYLSNFSRRFKGVPDSLALPRMVICRQVDSANERLADLRCVLAVEASSYRKHFVAPASFVLLAKSYCVT